MVDFDEDELAGDELEKEQYAEGYNEQEDVYENLAQYTMIAPPGEEDIASMNES